MVSFWLAVSIKRDNGDLEIECRELSQERLIELLHQGNLPEIKQTARRMGVSAGGSKLDIINRVQDALQKDIESTCFNKIFKKMGGCSGGWLTLACPIQSFMASSSYCERRACGTI